MKNFKKIFENLIAALSVLVVVLAITLCFYSSGYITSLLVSFVVQFSWLSGGLFLITLVYKKWKLTMLNLFAFSLFLSFYYPFYKNYRVEGEADFSIAHFNVLKYNNNYQQSFQVALETGADMISFQETDFGWCEYLKNNITNEYPYSYLHPRKDCYGMALLSKYKLKDLCITEFKGCPILEGVVDLGTKEVSFISIHTRAPIGRSNFNVRNEQICKLIKDVNKFDGPKIVVGDFNSVPWDSAILGFKSNTKLLDSRSNISATYPSFLAIMAIPIDFIFHSNEIQCLHFSTVSGSSSDHFGVVGEYKIF